MTSRYDPNNKYTLRDPVDVDGKVMRDNSALDRKVVNDKAQADLLAPTDWLYIRRADIAAPVPLATQAYRDAVRAAHDAREAWLLDEERTIDDLVTTTGCPDWPTLPGSPENTRNG